MKNSVIKQWLCIILMGSLLACSSPKQKELRLGNTCGNLLGQGIRIMNLNGTNNLKFLNE